MRGLLNRKVGLEAKLQDLETRRAGVVRRVEAAAMKAEEAFAAQRAFLVETGGEDAAQAKRLADACRRTADERAALEDAARVLAEQITDAKAAIDTERDRKARAEVAGQIEAGAAAIEAAAIELDKAATAFDAARARLVSVCRESAPHDPILGHGPDGGFVTAAGRLAGILSRESPFQGLPGFDHPVGAVPAAAITVKAMRENARAVREGLAPSKLPQKPLEIPTAAVFPMVRMCLWRPAFYRSHLGNRVDLYPSNCEAPEPIAAKAFEMGVAFQPDTPAGKRVMALIATDPTARIEVSDDGVPRAVRFTGALGNGGKGLPPAPDPVNLGMLPDCYGVILPEAAQ